MLRRLLHMVIALATLGTVLDLGGFLSVRIPDRDVASAVSSSLFVVGCAAVVWLMCRLEALAAARDAARRDPPGFDVVPPVFDGHDGRESADDA